MSERKERRPCAQRVYSGERSDWGGHMCQRAAVVQEDGKWWCRTHAPAAVDARRQSSEARWAAGRARRDASWAVEAVERDVLKRVRECECSCDQELARLRRLLLAADENKREVQR